MTSVTNTAAQATALAENEQPRRTRRFRKPSDDTRKINWWATAFIAVCSLTVLIPLYLAVMVALKTPAIEIMSRA